MGLGVLITVNNQPDEMLTHQVSNIEIYEKAGQATTYKIRFMVDICDTDIAKGLEETTDPQSILGVVVEVNDQLSCLVSGPVIKQEASIEHGGSGSWLEVEGSDLTHLMEKITNKKLKTGSDADIVSGILRPEYVQYLDVENTPNSNHEENKNALVQQETDLSFVRRLAQRNGFHFWITYDAKGNATGHFRSIKIQGQPQAELLVNLPKVNIDNLQIKWDLNRITETEGSQVDQNTKKIIGGKVTLKDEEKLAAKPFHELVGPKPHTMNIAPPVASGGALQKRGEAALKEAQWFIQATCKTSLNRICKLIRCHTVINVQGAGNRHSGKYYVTGVKHIIDAVAHVMEIELARNSWGNENDNSPLSKIF